MKIPPEITYRGVNKTDAIAELVDRKIAKLEQACDHISSCHVAIEKVQERPRDQSPYRVRLDITVPPGHEIAAESNMGGRTQYPEIEAVIRNAFDKAWRQLRDLNKQQHEHNVGSTNDGSQGITALVTKLFPENDYGFLKTIDNGEDVYFGRNSVTHAAFDQLAIGTGVRFEAIQDSDGLLHATTVQIVDKPGASVGKSSQSTESLIEPPLGWQ